MRSFKTLTLLLLSLCWSGHVARAEAVGVPSLSHILLQANNIVEVGTVRLNEDGGEFKIIQTFGDSEFKVDQVIQINFFAGAQVQYGLRDEDRETIQKSTRILFFLRRVLPRLVERGPDDRVQEYYTQPLWYWNDRQGNEYNRQATTKGNMGFVWGGIRLLTKKGQVLRPSHEGSWRGPTLYPIQDATWEQLLKFVGDNTAALEELKLFKNIEDREQRGSLVLGWLKNHRELLLDAEWAEYAEPTINQKPSSYARPNKRGWNALALEAFGWVMKSGDPETCWQAIKLYQEVPPRPGSGTPDKPLVRKVFGSFSGRKLLLDIAVDDKQSLADRNLALYYTLFNFWKDDEAKGLEFVSADATEQNVLIDRLLPLLQSNEPSLRESAAGSIGRVSHPNNGTGVEKSKRALPALSAALERETNEDARKTITQVIHGIENWN